MKIATWNVNGVRARAAQLEAWLSAEQPDVVCLQEIKATVEQIPESLQALPGYRCHWHGMKGYSGVAILVRPAIADEIVISHPAYDEECRAMIARVGAVDIASFYVPNGGKDFAAKLRFLEAMDAHAQTLGDRSVVWCGDLNVARTDVDVHPKERKTTVGQLPEERALIERILSRGLVDLGRAQAPEDEGLFTWWAPWRSLRQKNVGWRIDYLLASGALAERTRSCVVHKDVGTSDHAPVVAEIDV